MKQFLAKHWWVFLLRGIFAIVFGVLALVWPHITILSLVLVWGAYAFADGIIALYTAISGQTHGDDRWLVALQGAIGVIAGVIAFFMPLVATFGLLIAIAAWSLVVGVLQIVSAIKLRKEITGEFWLGLSGLVSIIFAFFIMAEPQTSAVALVWVIGIYAIIFGFMLVAFAFRIKGQAATA